MVTSGKRFPVLAISIEKEIDVANICWYLPPIAEIYVLLLIP